jgi:hypothetical protein
MSTVAMPRISWPNSSGVLVKKTAAPYSPPRILVG